MGYVLHTPSEYTNRLGDAILYADNKVVARYSTFTKERDIPKPQICNCPNCGAPKTGPICEYCGSILDQAEIDRQEQELAEKQRQYEELLRQWQQTKIQAENGYGLSPNRWTAQSQLHFPKTEPFIVEQIPLKEDKISFTKLLAITILISALIVSAILFYNCYHLA